MPSVPRGSRDMPVHKWDGWQCGARMGGGIRSNLQHVVKPPIVGLIEWKLIKKSMPGVDHGHRQRVARCFKFLSPLSVGCAKLMDHGCLFRKCFEIIEPVAVPIVWVHCVVAYMDSWEGMLDGTGKHGLLKLTSELPQNRLEAPEVDRVRE